MGCFYVNCALTGLPVVSGDRVHVFFVAVGNDGWRVVSLPFKARMDDYGLGQWFAQRHKAGKWPLALSQLSSRLRTVDSNERFWQAVWTGNLRYVTHITPDKGPHFLILRMAVVHSEFFETLAEQDPNAFKKLKHDWELYLNSVEPAVPLPLWQLRRTIAQVSAERHLQTEFVDDLMQRPEQPTIGHSVAAIDRKDAAKGLAEICRFIEGVRSIGLVVRPSSTCCSQDKWQDPVWRTAALKFHERVVEVIHENI